MEHVEILTAERGRNAMTFDRVEATKSTIETSHGLMYGLIYLDRPWVSSALAAVNAKHTH